MQGKSEVDILVGKLKVPKLSSVALQHFFVKNDLVWLKNLHLALLSVLVFLRCQKRILRSLERFKSFFRFGCQLLVRSLDHFCSEQINMSLLKRYWLGKNIEARTHEIHVDHLVIAHDTVYSLVVVAAHDRSEVDLNTNKRMSLDDSFGHREAKDVEPIRQELEADWKVRVVMHCK